MHQTIFISLPIEDFQNVLTDCVNTCLRTNQKEQSEQIKNDRWMDINELCQYHPDKPTKATVYGWVNARAIPVHKGGKKLRFLVSEIDEWLLSNKLQSQAEMVNEAGKYLVNKNGGKR